MEVHTEQKQTLIKRLDSHIETIGKSYSSLLQTAKVEMDIEKGGTIKSQAAIDEFGLQVQSAQLLLAMQSCSKLIAEMRQIFIAFDAARFDNILDQEASALNEKKAGHEALLKKIHAEMLQLVEKTSSVRGSEDAL
eukprot:TRINITY_DN2252_c0_g1_i2.p1 TRINITY_DN2252_c0_g1~~TRINITY_DN2252_c0_g1_i2.p1  ORF type:complete len:145 (-),score=30.26 TRINITY_DN2252_c0_g1_i2:37-444(-)